MRRLLAKLWVVVFALSYSAAALAVHCQVHFAGPESGVHSHHHSDHDHDAPMPPAKGDGCAAMAWEKMLGPAPAHTAPAPAAPDNIFLPFYLTVVAPIVDRHGLAASAWPPPDIGPDGYARVFSRTRRLLI